MRRRYKYKAKKKESGAAVKRLVKDLMGNRPSLNQGLTSVLNWYNQTYQEPQQAYDAALQYLIDTGAEKTTARWTEMRAELLKRVTGHTWAIADLLNSGEALETDVVNRYRLHIKKLLDSAEKAVPRLVREAKVKTADQIAHDLIGDIEQMIDQAFAIVYRMKRPPFNYAAFIAERQITTEQQNIIANYYRPQYQEYVDAYKQRIEEGYEHIKPVQLKAMADVLSSIILANVESPRVERKPRVPRKTKVKVTKTGTKTRGTKAPMPSFHNQSATIIYYPGQKQVAVLFAEDNKKLILKRKTIQNINTKRSYAKRFGKQQNTLTNLKRSSFDKVLKFVETVSATKIPAPGRYRENGIIINIKG